MDCISLWSVIYKALSWKVEIDAMTLVQLLIKDKGPDTHGLSTVLNDCKLVLDRLKAKVHYFFREANRSADAVVKLNCNSSDLVVFQTYPKLS